jgi:hypothetical protein
VRTGDLIYQRLRDGFEDSVFDAPPPCSAASDYACLCTGAQKLLAIFQRCGFAFAASLVEVDTTNRRFRVRLDGPATLYAVAMGGGGSLQPLPAFAEITIAAFLRASGVKDSSISIATRASRSTLEFEVVC